jgi:hypothetical protein
MVAFTIYSASARSEFWDPLWQLAIMIPMGAVYGFGFAFGWPYAKRWMARMFGVAVTGSMLAILFSRVRRQSFCGER